MTTTAPCRDHVLQDLAGHGEDVVDVRGVDRAQRYVVLFILDDDIWTHRIALSADTFTAAQELLCDGPDGYIGEYTVDLDASADCCARPVIWDADQFEVVDAADPYAHVTIA